MPNAARILIVALAAAALAACHRSASQNAAVSQDMSIEGNLAAGQPPANVQIETLPPDESSGTSSRELNAGEDNPDVNDLSNSH
jgi:curli biogenesis system outer membrane secretion channel CsgG